MASAVLNDTSRAKFVEVYCKNGYNAQAAVREIFNKGEKVHRQLGDRFLKDHWVQTQLALYRSRSMKEAEVSEDKIIKELMGIAFMDITEMLDDDGNILPMSKIPLKIRRALASLDVISLEGKGKVGKFKAESKLKAIELLGKHLGMFNTSKVEISGTATLASLVSEITGAEAREVNKEEEACPNDLYT